jgi:hypothetical protein
VNGKEAQDGDTDRDRKDTGNKKMTYMLSFGRSRLTRRLCMTMARRPAKGDLVQISSCFSHHLGILCLGTSPHRVEDTRSTWKFKISALLFMKDLLPSSRIGRLERMEHFGSTKRIIAVAQPLVKDDYMRYS